MYLLKILRRHKADRSLEDAFSALAQDPGDERTRLSLLGHLAPLIDAEVRRYGWLRPPEVEELAAELVLCVLKDAPKWMDRYRSERGQLIGFCRLQLHSTCYQELRRLGLVRPNPPGATEGEAPGARLPRRHREVASEDLALEIASDTDLCADVDKEIDLNRIRSHTSVFLSQLDSQDRLLFEACQQESVSREELAEYFSIARNTVDQKYKRIKQRLQHYLSEALKRDAAILLLLLCFLEFFVLWKSLVPKTEPTQFELRETIEAGLDVSRPHACTSARARVRA